MDFFSFDSHIIDLYGSYWRDIHIYVGPYTRWPAHRYAWDHTDGVPATHEYIHAHRDTCLFAGPKILYQEVLLAEVPCPIRRYIVLVSVGNKIDRSGIDVGELLGNQPDLYRANPLHAAFALHSHNNAECYGYTFGDSNALTNRDGYSKEYVHAFAHLYGYPDQHVYTHYTQHDTNLYTFPYINGYAVANIYKHGNIHANEYTNGVSEC